MGNIFGVKGLHKLPITFIMLKMTLLPRNDGVLFMAEGIGTYVKVTLLKIEVFKVLSQSFHKILPEIQK